MIPANGQRHNADINHAGIEIFNLLRGLGQIIGADYWYIATICILRLFQNS